MSASRRLVDFDCNFNCVLYGYIGCQHRQYCFALYCPGAEGADEHHRTCHISLYDRDLCPAYFLGEVV